MDLFLREVVNQISAGKVLWTIDALIYWDLSPPMLERRLGGFSIGLQRYEPLCLFKCLLIEQLLSEAGICVECPAGFMIIIWQMFAARSSSTGWIAKRPRPWLLTQLLWQAQHSTSSISKPQQDTAECEAFNDLAVYFCADPDARWVKKGFKSTLYYTVFECIYEDGSTDHTHTASANWAGSP